MIFFVQPFGFQTAGGGPRILRALLHDSPEPFLSVCTSPGPPPPTRIGPEIHLPIRPGFGRLERSRFQARLWRLAPLFLRRFEARLDRLCRERGATVLHAIPHGLEFWSTFRVARRLGLPYILNVHDDLSYNLSYRHDLAEALRRFGEVWAAADRCLVISEAMGEEYCRRYGQRPYSVVTDGLASVPNAPRSREGDTLRVYFAGMCHGSYAPNFIALAAALDRLREASPNRAISLTIRGGTFVLPREVSVRDLPWASEAEVAGDLDEADLLYLPLPFDPQHQAFVRYSLSTKLVTYLGSGIPILYHGPADAAAGRLLAEHEAALCLNSLDPANIERGITAGQDSLGRLASNALLLAREQFLLQTQRQRLWDAVTDARSEKSLCNAY